MTEKLSGKIVLITGAASGIGRETARLLAREGATIVLGDIDGTRGEEVAALIRADGGRAAFHGLDVTSEEAWQTAMAAVQEQYGRLDVLINSAGIGQLKDVASMTFAEWRRIIAINLDGVFLGIHHAVPLMIQTGGGSIINLSSIYGIVGLPGGAAYCASKGGVALMTKALAVELAPQKIRVNAIHPGFIETPMTLGPAEREGEEALAAAIALHPAGRMGYPSEIAEAVLFLAGEGCTFMTGSSLVIDGGYTAR